MVADNLQHGLGSAELLQVVRHTLSALQLPRVMFYFIAFELEGGLPNASVLGLNVSLEAEMLGNANTSELRSLFDRMI